MSRSTLFHQAMRAYEEGDAHLALRLMEECAGNGDPVACFTVALWYRDGDGVPANALRSKQWLAKLEQLAEEDNPEAQWGLGQHLRFGKVISQDTERANYWLERAAKGGHGE